MCRCKYPKVINKKAISIIEDEKSERCYRISFDFGKKGSDILIITRAPKEIEEDSCNSLYRRIIKFLEMNKECFKGIRKVTVVSLFALYEASREELYQGYLLRGRDYIEGNDGKIINDSIITKAIKECVYIIVAWGEPLEGLDEIYRNRVEFVLRKIREEMMNSDEKKSILTVGDISKKGYPKHCLAWSYRDKLIGLWD